MKRRFLSNQWKAVKLGLASTALALFTLAAQAQDQSQHSNPNVRLGQKALLDGDFKSAATHLQKALPSEANDPDVQYLLGYSQFHNGEYTKAIETFKKVIALDPKHTSAYYYKAKASNNMAVGAANKLANGAKEQLLKTAIEDYSKAIAITANDAKLYQNRAIAYRDLGILTGTSGAANYDKAKAADAYNKAVSDYEKVLTYDASRKDIQTEVKKAKVYRDNLK
ncbi:tetratricopeptide repeat protein [Sphingobacterium oryzagri]|uniref:Tetratricopeptide repeat protein n=1 Tax=Sphingobacterium oryzagri TaxID=3025669 RepID=A0ABY7WRR9_9SPHI|nr:tetratricopeptide repeat protein [Sphingobacterium sp. KACC 22765]WDF70004.1 tetratricopeptide repeat protein [Sphingobacterium sp. KACC 22765]